MGFAKPVIVFVILVLDSYSSLASKQLALKLVASIEGHILTNRDVDANYLVDRALYNDGKFAQLNLGTEEFNEALNRLLVEMMVSDEATFFEVAKVTDSEKDQALESVKTKIQGNPSAKVRWAHGAVTDSELKTMVTRKLRANRFIRYKSNSSYVEPSEEEARAYFEKNRLKFGTMEFNKFKGSIQKFLGNKTAKERLRDWFDILRKKHKVKNYMTGSVNYDFSSSTNK